MNDIIKSLFEAYKEKYELSKAAMCPATAAKFAVDDLLNMYRHSVDKEMYLKQELEDIIEGNAKRTTTAHLGRAAVATC